MTDRACETYSGIANPSHSPLPLLARRKSNRTIRRTMKGDALVRKRELQKKQQSDMDEEEWHSDESDDDIINREDEDDDIFEPVITAPPNMSSFIAFPQLPPILDKMSNISSPCAAETGSMLACQFCYVTFVSLEKLQFHLLQCTVAFPKKLFPRKMLLKLIQLERIQLEKLWMLQKFLLLKKS